MLPLLKMALLAGAGIVFALPTVADITLTTATATARQRVLLWFDGPLSEATFDIQDITFDPEVEIRGRVFHPDGQRIILETAPVEAGAAYLVKVPGDAGVAEVQYDADDLDTGLVSRPGDAPAAGKTIRDDAKPDVPFAMIGEVRSIGPHGYRFNGNSHITKPCDTLFKDGYTVSLWVKSTWEEQPALTGIFNTYSSTNPAVQLGFQIDVDHERKPNYRWKSQTEELVIGPLRTEWVHIAVTGSPGKIAAFYNGAWTNSLATSHLGRNFRRLALGVNRGNKRFFNGEISDLRVYDYPLHAGQIATLAETTHPGQE